MKRRGTTIDGTRLDPHWWSGYVADINGRRVRFTRYDCDWLARAGLWPRTIAGGRTLRDAVKAAKAA